MEKPTPIRTLEERIKLRISVSEEELDAIQDIGNLTADRRYHRLLSRINTLREVLKMIAENR